MGCYFRSHARTERLVVSTLMLRAAAVRAVAQAEGASSNTIVILDFVEQRTENLASCSRRRSLLSTSSEHTRH
jgi:hypothetical protein